MAKFHQNPAPHRRIGIGDKGHDVRRLKRAIRKRLPKTPSTVNLPAVKGAFGKRAFLAWVDVAYWLGLPVGHPPTKRAQAYVRWPWTRPPKVRKRAKSRRQAVRSVPIIRSGITTQGLFGGLGPELYVSGHHSAGPKDSSRAGALQLCRQYDTQHASQGWGGIGYHYCLPRSGGIILLRPVTQKGAHVGGYNSNNIGVLCHGTTGDRPTPEQQKAFKFLLANAHTKKFPKSHRTDRDLRKAVLRGHNDWPGHTSNACPGTHKQLYLSGGKLR